jgi:hypothetical protein
MLPDNVYLVCKEKEKDSKDNYEVLLVTETQEEAEAYSMIYMLNQKEEDCKLFLEKHNIIKAGVINEIFHKVDEEYKDKRPLE